MGRVATVQPGDSESFSHGWSGCYIFTSVFFAGRSQNLVCVSPSFGAEWTVSAFSASLLSPAFPQHTGQSLDSCCMLIFLLILNSTLHACLMFRTTLGSLQKLHYVTKYLEFSKDYFCCWDLHIVAIQPPSGTLAICGIPEECCLRYFITSNYDD